MAKTSTPTALTVEQWASKFWVEASNSLEPFKSLMGTGTGKPIQVNEDLTKKAGDAITFNLVTRLKQQAVLDDGQLEGNEESQSSYGHKVTVHQRRNAIRVPRMANKRAPADYLEVGRDQLMSWSVDVKRDNFLDALLSTDGGTTKYASEAEATRDAWAVANSDRVLYGEAKSNYSGDNSADIAKVDSTNDKLKGSTVSLMARMAKEADPKIRPIRIDGKGKFYVMLASPIAMRDLRDDLATHLSNAEKRGAANPLFTDGDLMWNNVLVKEVEEIAYLSAVGASSIDVAPCYLLGAQAVGMAIGGRSKFVTKKFDYDNEVGIAIGEIFTANKMIFNSKQHGVVTGFQSGAE